MEAKRAGQATEAEEVIRGIHGLVAAAGDSASVRIFGWVGFTDVAGDDPDKVDKLAGRLQAEKRALLAGDLAGRAAIVFAWCDANDLECFLVPVDVPLNDDEYDFHVRPKPY